MNPRLQIKAVNVYPFDVPLLAPFKIASTNLRWVNNILVEIQLQNGIKGYGEGGILHPVTTEDQQTALDMANAQIDYLLGANAGEWRRIARQLLERLQSYGAVQAAIETALLDALTRSWNIPLYQFFGGVTNQLETDITIPICSADDAEHLAKQYLQQGFATIKTKIGLDLDQDLQRLLAILRGHPQCKLILDANEGYCVAEAMEVLRLLQQSAIDIALFEQPLPREDWDGMGKLTRESGVCIAADESCRTPQDAMRIAKYGLAQVINIKLVKCGVVQAMEIAAIARANNLDLMMGEMVETRLGTGFSAHFAAGIGGFKWIDLDTPLLLATDPVSGGYRCAGAAYELDSEIPGNGSIPRND